MDADSPVLIREIRVRPRPIWPRRFVVELCDTVMTEKPRLGKLPPLYNFILNPHTDARFTRCPNCEEKMRQRKVPLFIHVEPMHPLALGYTCRYCPDRDLLIAHQDEIEGLLASLFDELKNIRVDP